MRTPPRHLFFAQNIIFLHIFAQMYLSKHVYEEIFFIVFDMRTERMHVDGMLR